MLFVDMDGTLNYFEKASSLEEITSEGYFFFQKSHYDCSKCNTLPGNKKS